MAYIQLLYLFILPPLAVARQFGIGQQFWRNTLLTLCGFFPGFIHGAYLLTSDPRGLRI